MKHDKIQIEILADGTIKFTTDPISGPNHVNAEQFLRMVGQLAGGETTRERRKDAHQHQHEHEHEHDHSH
jgi:hypothetical protein